MGRNSNAGGRMFGWRRRLPLYIILLCLLLSCALCPAVLRAYAFFLPGVTFFIACQQALPFPAAYRVLLSRYYLLDVWRGCQHAGGLALKDERPRFGADAAAACALLLPLF